MTIEPVRASTQTTTPPRRTEAVQSSESKNPEPKGETAVSAEEQQERSESRSSELAVA